MITITPDTKISAILKAHPGALNAIVSISPHFKKLKNPVLRKVLACRVTVADAARIGKCTLYNFAEKLSPLGISLIYNEEERDDLQYNMADETETLNHYDVLMDVRGIIKKGEDPFNSILKTIADLKQGGTLLLINSFVPIPLIKILEIKGCKISVANYKSDEIHTYITKTRVEPGLNYISNNREQVSKLKFDDIVSSYKDRLAQIDVRHLQAPQPMIQILDKLEELPVGNALYVYHKKIPMFLLPELKQRGFEYAFKEYSGMILMIIYKENKRPDETA